MPPHTSQGFPNRVDKWGDNLGKFGQKLHENFKIGVFGPKKRGEGHGGISQLFWVVADPP